MKKIKSYLEQIKFVFRIVVYYNKEIIKLKPYYFLSVFVLFILNAMFPFVNIITMKYIVDELIGNRDMRVIALCAGIVVISNSLYVIVKKYLVESQNSIGDEFERYYDEKLSYKTMNLDYWQTESTDILNMCTKAESGMKMAGSSMGVPNGVQGLNNNIIAILASTVVLFGVTAIMVKYSPLLLILVLINVIMSTYFNSESGKIEIKYFSKNVDSNRAFEYVCNELSDIKYGKDIRIYGAEGMMLNKQEELADILIEKEKMRGKELRKYSKKNGFFNSLYEGAMYIYLGIQGILKIITVGEFSALIQATISFTAALKDIVFNFVTLYKNAVLLNEYKKFMELETEGQKGSLKLSDQESYKIEFVNVDFKYPGSDNYTLQNINLTIRSGERLAIVGMNGAGKTTVVKLLCRFYSVTNGDILLNGKSIYEYSYSEYIRLLSVVFQDFKLFAFSLRENISFSSSSEEHEIIRLCNMGGLDDSIKKWEEGVDTVIYKQFEEKGVEPSGGEAQKIALVRALYKNAPIVILDEPTAALDPLSEYEIYNKFEQLVYGKTAIYISHRLSSCMFCDKIAVFSDGGIKEYGTHEELIQISDGIYKTMYMAQAQYYI